MFKCSIYSGIFSKSSFFAFKKVKSETKFASKISFDIILIFFLLKKFQTTQVQAKISQKEEKIIFSFSIISEIKSSNLNLFQRYLLLFKLYMYYILYTLHYITIY